MSQMKSRMKSNAIRRKHHKLEKALRNHKRSNMIIQMILSTSILNQFQAVTSLKNQMKERENREETDS